MVRMLWLCDRLRMISWLLHRSLLRLVRVLRLPCRFRLISWLLHRSLFRLVRMLRLRERFRLISWLLHRSLLRLIHVLRLRDRFRLISWLLHRRRLRLVRMLRRCHWFGLIDWLSVVPWQWFSPCLWSSGILRGHCYRIGNAMAVQQRIVWVKIARACRADSGEQNVIGIGRTRCAGTRKEHIISGNRRTAGAILNLIFRIIHPLTGEQSGISFTPHRVSEFFGQALAAG